jgi:chaperone required for assembly of F1-ATPase
MRDLLYPDQPFPAHAPSEPDPVRRAQVAMLKPLPKRFYTDVAIKLHEERFAVTLDGRIARTPARHVLSLPTLAAAEVLAAEWQAQEVEINPAKMPATRLVNAALDHVSVQMGEVAADISKYVMSDLVCYRATDPAGLVEMQAAAWDPVVTYAHQRLGVRLLLAEGILHRAQPAEAEPAMRRAVGTIKDPIALAGLHVMTTLSGSCLIALMAAEGVLDVDAAFNAASIDEQWSAQVWGEDAEATHRMALRREEFAIALALLLAVAQN